MLRHHAPMKTLLLLLALAACPADDDDNGAFALAAEGLPEALLSVRATGPDDVWIVGAEQGSGPQMLHWDGAAWDDIDTSALGEVNLWWTWPTADSVWVAGSGGTIAEYDRATGEFAVVEGPSDALTFFGIWGASADDIWAVGSAVVTGEAPQIWRNTGGAWASWEHESFTIAGPGTNYFKVHGDGPNEVWIVGSNATAMHWNGAQMDVVSPVGLDTNLLTIELGDEGAVAVGGLNNGTILHWDQGVWDDRSPQFAAALNGVCQGAGGMTAVGARGEVHRWDGSGWESDEEWLTQFDYHGCLRTTDGALWAVGGHISSAPLNEGVIAYEGPSEVPSP